MTPAALTPTAPQRASPLLDAQPHRCASRLETVSAYTREPEICVHDYMALSSATRQLPTYHTACPGCTRLWIPRFPQNENKIHFVTLHAPAACAGRNETTCAYDSFCSWNVTEALAGRNATACQLDYLTHWYVEIHVLHCRQAAPSTFTVITAHPKLHVVVVYSRSTLQVACIIYAASFT